MTTRYISICLRALLLLMWAPAALATGVIVIDAGVQVSLALVGVSMLLSTLSGATALVLRLDRELRQAPDAPLIKPWLFCTAHMLGSWLAGIVAFIGATSAGLDVWLKLSSVVLGSFLGAKFLEARAEAFAGRGAGDQGRV